jgi:hypothetical protein
MVLLKYYKFLAYINPLISHTCIQLDKDSWFGDNLIAVLAAGWLEIESRVGAKLGKPALEGGLVLPLPMVDLLVELTATPDLTLLKDVLQEATCTYKTNVHTEPLDNWNNAIDLATLPNCSKSVLAYCVTSIIVYL